MDRQKRIEELLKDNSFGTVTSGDIVWHSVDVKEAAKNISELDDWIDVDDELPDNDTEVIIYNPRGQNGGIKNVWFSDTYYIGWKGLADKEPWFRDFGEGQAPYSKKNITHWMPKLKSPKKLISYER